MTLLRPLVRTLALLPALVAAEGHADTWPEPLQLRNLSPLYANLGVPVMASAALPSASTLTTGLQLQWASHALRESSGGLALELDGETQRVDLQLGYSPSERLTLRINLPWVRHRKGQLDGLIDDWHDLWGMPDGPRSSQPRDRIYFALEPGGRAPQLLDESASGIGDAEVTADLALVRGDDAALTAVLSLKLASGSRSDFTGGGDPALAAGLRYSRGSCLLDALSCHAQLGLVYSDGNALSSDSESWIPFYGLSLAWTLSQRIALLAQLEGQGRVYDSAPLPRNEPSVWGALGLRWQPATDWRIDALFTEDLQVGSAPDITFQLGIAHAF